MTTYLVRRWLFGSHEATEYLILLLYPSWLRLMQNILIAGYLATTDG
jgi:hypothetical protein